MAKVKEKILKAAREKRRVNYKGTPIRLSVDFLQKLFRTEGSGKIYSNSLEKNLQPRIIYPERLSFGIGGDIKNF